MNKTKKKRTNKRNYKKFILAFWLLFSSGLIAVVCIFGFVALGYMGAMPPLEQLENPKTNLATQILSSDGVVLGKFYFNDNRTPITYDELPQNIVEALIATEDERFYDHAREFCAISNPETCEPRLKKNRLHRFRPKNNF